MKTIDRSDLDAIQDFKMIGMVLGVAIGWIAAIGMLVVGLFGLL